MAAQDHIGPVGDEEIGHLLLIGGLGGLVLDAPVDHHGDEVGVQALGVGQLGGELLLVQGDAVAGVVYVEAVQGEVLVGGDGDAVGAVGVAQEGHGDAAHIGHDHAVVFVKLRLGAVGADVL